MYICYTAITKLCVIESAKYLKHKDQQQAGISHWMQANDAEICQTLVSTNITSAIDRVSPNIIQVIE